MLTPASWSKRYFVVVITLSMLAPTLSSGAATPVTVDFSVNQDVPLLKKFAIYNSGIVGQERYTPEILQSMSMIKAAALRIDLSIGKRDAGFADLMSGFFSDAQASAEFHFELIDTLAEGLQQQKVMPYWGLSYAPIPFQPECDGGNASEACFNSTATCRGFEDQAAVPGTNNYSCIPYGASDLDDCWKCPPKMEEDDSYSDWGQMVSYFHNHFLQKNITPMYEEHWNEPDLTEYYNPSLAAFKGSSQDYIDAYISCATQMLAIDPDLVLGGISAARQVTHNPEYPKQPNNEDTLLALAEQGLPMDFFSYHSITTDLGVDQIQLMLTRAQTSRNILSSPQLLNITGEINSYNTTEIHCNEFYPNSTVETLTSEFADSPYLATMLLETWNLLLDETDLAMVHWAQYMDVRNTSDQIGLLDFSGRPRVPWFAFRWYGDLPVERVALEVNSPHVHGFAGYSERECAAGILLWNTPHPRRGYPQEEATVSLLLRNVPFARFNLEAYIIDDKKHPQSNSFEYGPAVVYSNQTADQTGTYLFPFAAYSGVRLPVNGTIYLKLIQQDSCTPVTNSKNSVPREQILRTHNYYGNRPYRTSSYAHFHPRDWSAYLGMGDESEGFVITGATVRAEVNTTFNISMNILDGQIPAGGIAGIRMDLSAVLSDGSTRSYQQSASYFFYQSGTAPCVGNVTKIGSLSGPPEQPLDLSAGSPTPSPEGISQIGGAPVSEDNYLFASKNSLSAGTSGRKLQQNWGPAICGPDNSYVQIPPLWGTEAGVRANNFLPVQLSSFQVTPGDFAPAGWDGRVMLLFVMKDGTPRTKVRAYVTEQPGST